MSLLRQPGKTSFNLDLQIKKNKNNEHKKEKTDF